jgi:hydrogenase maturation protease
MLDLGQQLEALSSATVLWLGLGNPDAGDDAAGLRLAEALQTKNIPGVAMANLRPEQWIAHADLPPGAHLIFLDAADFSAQPGAVAFFDAAQIQARFPQISTHRIALSTLARLLFDRGAAGVWLLGIQPASLRLGQSLSPAVQFTVELLERLILRRFGSRTPDDAPPSSRVPISYQVSTAHHFETPPATGSPPP